MKNLKLLVLILLISMSAYSQKAFNPWSLDAEIGGVAVNDPSYVSSTSTQWDTHLALGVRYNLNETFGISLRGARENIEGRSFGSIIQPSQNITADYKRINLEANVNLLKVVDLYSPWFTMIAHGGPGISFTETSNDYQETIAQLSGGITGIFKLSNSLGFKIDYSLTSHIDQQRSLDGMFDSNSEGMSSNIHSASAGIIVWLGRRGKVPADFYRKEECKVVHNNTYVTNKPTTHTSNTTTIKEEYTPKIVEYVFFDHDKSELRGSELNAMYKIFEALKADSNAVVRVTGWASDTTSSADYNLRLSERRCEQIRVKLINMGINNNRIIVNAKGKDYDFKGVDVHEMGRRIQLSIK